MTKTSPSKTEPRSHDVLLEMRAFALDAFRLAQARIDYYAGVHEKIHENRLLALQAIQAYATADSALSLGNV